MALSIQRSVSGLLEKFRFPVRYPRSAIEIRPSEVAAVRLRGERGGGRIAGYGLSPIGASGGGASPLWPKGEAPEDLRQAMVEALRDAGIRTGKASLLLPDSIARTWLLQLPEIPHGSQAMLEMIRWKIKRGVPFRIEDAVIAWHVLSRPSGADPGVVLVGLIPRAQILQYEALLASMGLKIGLVDLSSFNLFNAYRHVLNGNGKSKSAPARSDTSLSLGSEDLAVLHATDAYFTLMLLRSGALVFYRCKTHAEGEASTPEERLRTFRRELATSLSYYTEKLKGVNIARTFVHITDEALDDGGEVLRSLGFGGIEPIDPAKIASLPSGIERKTALCLVPAIGAAMRRSR